MSDNTVKLATRESIAPGVIVRLKSGGPDMTVVERSPNFAYVMWSKDDGSDVMRDWLPTACLEVKR